MFSLVELIAAPLIGRKSRRAEYEWFFNAARNERANISKEHANYPATITAVKEFHFVGVEEKLIYLFSQR